MFNSVIKSNDFDAVTKIQENIEMFESRLAYMQSINDYFKENGTTLGHPEIPDETAMELDSRVKDGQATPYPGQFFTENRKEIARLKSVIERIQNNPETVFQCWDFNGGSAVINLANNRLQLMFDEKPSEEWIGVLKKNGFIIIDPEREYSPLVMNLGGESIKLSVSSSNHINAMAINKDVDDENPVSMKSELLISIFDELLKSGSSRMGGGVGAKDKSIIDRCTIRVYADYSRTDWSS